MDIVKLNIKDIIPYERNAKKHDKKQIENVMESIRQFGFVQPVVVDSDNVLIIGHCRFMAAKRLEMNEIDAVVAKNLTKEQADKLRLLDMLDEEVTSKNGEKMTLGARMTKSMIAIASDPRQGASALKAYQTIMHIIGQDEPEIQKEESSFDLDEFKIKLDE